MLKNNARTIVLLSIKLCQIVRLRISKLQYLSFLWKNYFDAAETCAFAAIGLFEVALEVDVIVALTAFFLHPRAAIYFSCTIFILKIS